MTVWKVKRHLWMRMISRMPDLNSSGGVQTQQCATRHGKGIERNAASRNQTTNYHGAQPPSAATEESSQVGKISNDSSAATGLPVVRRFCAQSGVLSCDFFLGSRVNRFRINRDDEK